MTISERISAALKEKGITQKALANVLNVTPSTVCTWVKTNSESIPSAYIMPICRTLGMEPEELLDGVVPQPEQEKAEGEQFFLNENESRLVSILRKLDWEGSTVVLHAAIQELRRIQGNECNGESETNVG